MTSVLVAGSPSFATAPALLASPLVVLLGLVRVDSLASRPVVELVKLIQFNRVS
jgi:hypothetical protein